MTILITKPNEYTGRIWPNGEFGYAFARKASLHPLPPVPDAEELRWNVERLKVHGFQEASYAAWNEIKMPASAPDVSGETVVSPFGSSNLPKSHKKSRGRSGLTSYGGKMLRNGCYLMEKRYGKHRLSFLTLTLPDLKDEDWRPVVQGWGEILRVFFQWLTRQQRKHGLDTCFVSCTEVQPERFERTGKVALHIHCVFLGRREKRGWIVTPKQVRQAWKRALSTFLSGSPNSYTWSSVENLVRVKKSVAAYLSKYISKGRVGMTALVQASASIPLPASWWNSSMSLRRWIKKEVVKLDGDGVSLLLELKEMKSLGVVLFFRSITVTKEELRNGIQKFIPFVVGAKGVIKPDMIHLFK